jgi:outer membrane protein assembly factor BamE
MINRLAMISTPQPVALLAIRFDDQGTGLLYDGRVYLLCPSQNKMRKFLTFQTLSLFGLAALVATGCAGKQKQAVTDSSVLDRLPFVYKMTVQQGNIVTPEMVDQLQLGMNKRQVRYLLGTPLLTDFFNQDRWDYIYTLKRGREPGEQRKLTVFFQDDALARIEGDVHPNPKQKEADKPKEMIVTVPDYQDRRGLITRGLEAVGIKKGQ